MYSDVHELHYSKIKTYKECPLLYKYKYMDDKISGWTTAGYYTVNILLFPLMILALAAAK